VIILDISLGKTFHQVYTVDIFIHHIKEPGQNQKYGLFSSSSFFAPPYYKIEIAMVKVTVVFVNCKQEKHAHTWTLKGKAFFFPHQTSKLISLIN